MTFPDMPREEFDTDEKVLEFAPFPSNNQCQLCPGDDDIILCDACPKTYHAKCVDKANDD